MSGNHIKGVYEMEYEIVPSPEKEVLREYFINAFVDTNNEYYKKYIATLKQYPDGLCYDGYLWDVLNEPYENCKVLQEEAISFLKNKTQVFVMWDIYSNSRVVMNDKIRLNNPKDCIISVDANELCDLILSEWSNDLSINDRYLPTDIYVFDDVMNWCVVFTHEGDDSFTNPSLEEDDYIRICFVIDRT